jgi:hypothetical protein
MDPDQTAWMRRLVWIHAGRKRIMLVLSLRGSVLCLRLREMLTINTIFDKIAPSHKTQTNESKTNFEIKIQFLSSMSKKHFCQYMNMYMNVIHAVFS